MTEFHGAGELPSIPDDLTLVQFLHDHEHHTRPAPRTHSAWLIEDASGRKVTYDEVKVRTNALANAFSSRWKIGEDDAVCIYSPNHIDYPIVVWAAFRVGAVITAANPAYTADELVYQLKTTNAKLLVVHPWVLPVAIAAAKAVGLSEDRIVLIEASSEGAPAGASKHVTLQQLVDEGLSSPQCFIERRLKPGEAKTKIAFLSFSSGTTGLPKAVKIPHYSPIANLIQLTAYVQREPVPAEKRRYRPGDVSIGVLPFYHIYGQVIVMHWTIYIGMSVVVIPKFDFLSMLASIQRFRINFLLFVPPMVVGLCKHPAVQKYDLSSVKLITSGAAPLSAELTNQLAKRFPHISIGQGYGMTETSTAISLPQLDQHVGTPGSAGALVPGVSVRVVREDGSLASYGEPGELVVKSPSNAIGYLNNEEATRETFRNGWVHTGDEVYINEKMEMFVVDRIKDLIKVKGFQVAPPELEGHLLELPEVSDVSIVGKPDEYSGELPYAFVVLSASALENLKKDPASAETLKTKITKHVADHKVHFKRLGGVEFIDVIPRNPSGKLLRRVLRDRLRAATSAAAIKAKL